MFQALRVCSKCGHVFLFIGCGVSGLHSGGSALQAKGEGTSLTQASTLKLMRHERANTNDGEGDRSLENRNVTSVRSDYMVTASQSPVLMSRESINIGDDSSDYSKDLKMFAEGDCEFNSSNPAPIGLIFNIDRSGSVTGVPGSWEQAKEFATTLGDYILANSGARYKNGVIFTQWAQPNAVICPSDSYPTFETNVSDYTKCMNDPESPTGPPGGGFHTGAKLVEDTFDKFPSSNWTCWALLMSDCGGGPECDAGKQWVDNLRNKQCLVIGVVFGNYGEGGKKSMKGLASPGWFFEVAKMLELMNKLLPLIKPPIKECAKKIQTAILEKEKKEDELAKALMESVAHMITSHLSVLVLIALNAFVFS